MSSTSPRTSGERERLTFSLLLSVSLHVPLLSLTFGGQGFLSGFGIAWGDRRVETHEIRVKLVTGKTAAAMPGDARDAPPVVERSDGGRRTANPPKSVSRARDPDAVQVLPPERPQKATPTRNAAVRSAPVRHAPAVGSGRVARAKSATPRAVKAPPPADPKAPTERARPGVAHPIPVLPVDSSTQAVTAAPGTGGAVPRDTERRRSAPSEQPHPQAGPQEFDRLANEQRETQRRDLARQQEQAAPREAARLEAERAQAARLAAEQLEEQRRELVREQEETARIEAARIEAARLEAEREQAAQLAAEQLEAQRRERVREQEEAARIEAARIEAARLEAEREQAAQLAAEQLEAQRRELVREQEEAARIEAARIEAARIEAARIEAARIEAARLEAEREQAAQLAAEQLEAQRRERVREQEEAARIETARLEAERREAERLAAERLEAQRRELASQQEEAARVEAARRQLERQEAARLAAERLESQRRELARQQEEAARIETEKLAAARQQKERLAAEQREVQRRDQERLLDEARRPAAVPRDAEPQKAAGLPADSPAAPGRDAARPTVTPQQEGTRLPAGTPDEEVKRQERLRAIGRQLDEEALARRGEPIAALPAPSTLPLSLSTSRRVRLYGRTHPNAELVRYAEAWAQKIQLNTSVDTVRGAAARLRTPPVLTVAVRSDGSVESVAFELSSGATEVDETIRNIVRSQENYPAFPPALARDYDVIEIRRTWHFDSAVRLF